MKQLNDIGFRWWIGKIEDRNDPLKLGRVRVRVFNLHGDPASTPTESLHWWNVTLPTTSSSENQVGISPTGLQVGSVVWGFFADGYESQFGIVCGVLVGDGDVSVLAQGVNSIHKDPVGPEPESAYRAQYPYNKVFQSESGHVVEIDDTPNFERLHTYHRSGTYSEIDHEGRRVNKIVGDDFEIVQRGKQVWVQGNLNITVLGNATIKASLVTIDTPLTKFTGNIEVAGGISTGTGSGAVGDVAVNGRVNVTGDVIGGGISLDHHIHGGVKSGGDLSGPPQ
jgi:hypothetical protein